VESAVFKEGIISVIFRIFPPAQRCALRELRPTVEEHSSLLKKLARAKGW
jgi:hypothetical protein